MASVVLVRLKMQTIHIFWFYARVCIERVNRHDCSVPTILIMRSRTKAEKDAFLSSSDQKRPMQMRTQFL